MADLGMFEDRKIIGTTIAIRNAGDGLSAALAIDPQELHQGETVFVVLECKVGSVAFDPVKDSESDCIRKHVLKAGTGLIVDPAVVKEAVDAQTAKIIEAKEREKGIQQLPTNENLIKAHDRGDHHATPYIGCPSCEAALSEPKAPAK